MTDFGTPADGPEPINLDALVRILAGLGISSHVEHTGGDNTAALYAGPCRYDPDAGADRYTVVAGPGFFEGPGWSNAWAFREEFTIGRDDPDLTRSQRPPLDATTSDLATLIADRVQTETDLSKHR